jgi:hypothetical protein
MKGLIRTKTRSRGRDWAVFVHPDEKKGVLRASTGGDALRFPTGRLARSDVRVTLHIAPFGLLNDIKLINEPNEMFVRLADDGIL